MKLKQQRKYQSGAVALFVVIFSTLLMIVITLSFIQLMLKDQQQATASDLSQSAYDSALSGVEDAKRLLLLDQSCRDNRAPSSVNCTAIATAIAAGECDTVSTIFGDPADTETLIQQSEGDKALQQAYTCIKISANTPDYKGQIEMNQSNMIPLRGVSQFDTIELSWFTREDVSAVTNSPAVGFPSPDNDMPLPPLDACTAGSAGSGGCWDDNNPSLMRAQFMQTGDNFTLAEFDSNASGNRSNSNTLFLYPSASAGSSTDYIFDARRAPAGEEPVAKPQLVGCFSSFNDSEYACMARITLPSPINGSAANRNAYLRLSALYNGAHYKIQLLNGGTPVLFDRVQPEVDSTGRANDMFRRVKSRIEFKSEFIYPEAAIDIVGDLCKNFTITDRDADYTASPTCTP